MWGAEDAAGTVTVAKARLDHRRGRAYADSPIFHFERRKTLSPGLGIQSASSSFLHCLECLPRRCRMGSLSPYKSEMSLWASPESQFSPMDALTDGCVSFKLD